MSSAYDFSAAGSGPQPGPGHAGRTGPSRSGAPVPREFDAAIFDMDGVVTQTAVVHTRAWKRMFDDFLRAHAAASGPAFAEFTPGDYLAHVDGRPRYRGVEAFLRSRGIALPFGTPDDPPDAPTVCGLGNRKNDLFNRFVADSGVQVYASTIALIHALQAAGVAIGLATSSRNSAAILEKSGAAPLFATVIDGLVSETLGLAGKPEPDIFLAAAVRLGVAPARALVFEDAVTGVQAGARGQFALVIGIARENNSAELREHGADLVVRDLAETNVDDLARRVRAHRTAAAAPSGHPQR